MEGWVRVGMGAGVVGWGDGSARVPLELTSPPSDPSCNRHRVRPPDPPLHLGRCPSDSPARSFDISLVVIYTKRIFV